MDWTFFVSLLFVGIWVGLPVMAGFIAHREGRSWLAAVLVSVVAPPLGIALAAFQRPKPGTGPHASLRAKLIVGLLPEQGLSLQARWRQYRSSDSDVDGAYFNPDTYRNWDAGLSMRRRIAGWTLSGLAGAGRERVADTGWQTTSLAELRAEGPFAGKARIAFNLLYSRAAGFASADDYWYGSANLNIVVPLAR